MRLEIRTYIYISLKSSRKFLWSQSLKRYRDILYKQINMFSVVIKAIKVHSVSNHAKNSQSCLQIVPLHDYLWPPLDFGAFEINCSVKSHINVLISLLCINFFITDSVSLQTLKYVSINACDSVCLCSICMSIVCKTWRCSNIAFPVAPAKYSCQMCSFQCKSQLGKSLPKLISLNLHNGD